MSALADMYIASPDWIKVLWISMPCMTIFATARLFRRGAKGTPHQTNDPPPVVISSRDPDFDALVQERIAADQALISQLDDK